MPDRPATALISAGPYRFSRNPLYVASALLYTGASLWFGALWTLTLLPFPLGILQFYVIAREERYLERRFGREYLDYKARVRRWL